MIHFVILAGGRGERFWPLSSPERPKQFLGLFAKKSFFQLTLKRLQELRAGFGKEKIKFWVVTEARYKNWVRAQAPSLPAGQVILEPVARNTAAAIGLAAKKIARQDPEGVMISFPSDHWIRPVGALRRVLRDAVRTANRTEKLGLLGIHPHFPAVGLGYIELKKKPRFSKAFPVVGFHEKPSLKRAKRWARSGRFLWNSGIFIWKAKVLLEELKKWLPDVIGKLETPRYRLIKPISIDYGVLEKSSRLFCVPAALQWDDLGSWENLWHSSRKDEMGNVLFSGSEWKRFDTTGCFVYTNGIKVATLGVSNLIIVQSPLGILVCDRNRAQQVRRLVG